MKTPEEMNKILEDEIAQAKKMNPDYDARAAVHAALEHTYMQGRSPMQIPYEELREISKKIGDHMVHLFGSKPVECWTEEDFKEAREKEEEATK